MSGGALSAVANIEHFASPGQVLLERKTADSDCLTADLINRETLNDQSYLVRQVNVTSSTRRPEMSTTTPAAQQQSSLLVSNLQKFIPDEVDCILLMLGGLVIVHFLFILLRGHEGVPKAVNLLTLVPAIFN